MTSKTRRGLIAGVLLVSLTACRQDMHDQPRYKPLAASDLFENGQAARPLIPGTVPRGYLRDDPVFYTGKNGTDPVDEIPVPITRALLERGRERYDIYCSPCHDRVGTGHGMVVRRGFHGPASFHGDRLREAPRGYFFDVITNGFGAMLDYRAQIAPSDRWAIVAYVEALQLSQHATTDDVPDEEEKRLEQEPAEAPDPDAAPTPPSGVRR